MPVDLAITGAARPLPSGLELCAYRVVQESLTNVLKHARPATARVTVDYAPDELRMPGLGGVAARSNVDIAGNLYVTEAAVKSHINRLMAKLNLSSRAQAVVVAYETGLVLPSRRR